ncbi:hypothetical protein PENANT_c013G06043 [Penicillium antarcticum]|uniref:Metallo-beta-lactamase domain-containing protein n=1 Tax=Penicillium antarcticum TaxID=416450 RepID=A0A1V6Q556_9EURO|nr:uncharacterized protein N7508_004118 [Penicillium antarcticum]KAJ5308739.1 hypothetical protein N7508_004118 [Penicillium antarcticum]OQD84369.1 hypothetical protein PENANT_c013G06043 [Penicillium antarcticum]
MSNKSTQSDWSDYLAARNAGLPCLPAVTQLSPEVVRIMGGNPGDMQLQGTNTYLVGNGQSRILVDTGEGCPIWLKTLVEYLDKNQLKISYVLLTHWHSDHVGGVPALLAQYPDLTMAVYKANPDRGQNPIKDGQTFITEGATLQALFTPGHSTDHMCFVMEENGAMFTGDNILGHGTSVALEDLRTYMESLRIMTHDMRIGGLQIGYPGHGAKIEDLSASLMTYTRHWEMREKRVLSAFSEGNGMPMLTTREVTASIYGPGMDALAGPSVTHVLLKLHEEGTIEFTLVGQEKKWYM